MKTTVSESEFRDAFRNIRPDNFSYAALGELYQWLEQYEDDTGEEIELDVIALCCEYSLYASALEAVQELCDTEEVTTEEEALEHLRDHTTVIEVDDGTVIVREF